MSDLPNDKTHACRIYTLQGLKSGTVQFPANEHARGARALVRTDDNTQSAYVYAALARLRIETNEPIYFC